MANSTDSRPNPDALLAQMQDEDRALQRGKLRIYFGASAGVGKTYAMLSAAQRAQRGQFLHSLQTARTKPAAIADHR